MSSESTSARFWNRAADKYARQPVADEAAYQEKLRLTREVLRPDMEMLEIGCGTGSTAIVHAPYVRHIRAIDISDKMIEIARGKADASGIDNVSFECSTVDELAAPAASYDVVLGMSILHLLDDKEAVIGAVHDMLQPGGVFITSTPCLGGMLRFAPMRVVIPIMRLFGRAPKVMFFSEAQLQASFVAAGFEIAHRWQPARGDAVFFVAKKP